MRDFDWLILSTLYSNNNISKTAEKLYSSQPNITKRLRKIEEEMKMEIVVRSARGVTFTPKGEFLAKRADAILQLIEETKRQTQQIGSKNQGIIKIAAPNSFTRNELPNIMMQYRQKNNHVQFHLINCLSNEIPSLIDRREVDVGFVHGHLDSHEESVFLFHETLFVVSREKITISDLPSHPQIDYIRSTLTSKIINEWWQGHFSTKRNVLLRVSHGDICCELIRKGLGFGFFFGNNFIGNDSNLNRMIAMRDAENPEIRETWMIFNKLNARRVAVRNFVEFIKGWKEQHH